MEDLFDRFQAITGISRRTEEKATHNRQSDIWLRHFWNRSYTSKKAVVWWPCTCKKHLFHNCKGHSKRDTRSIQQYEIWNLAVWIQSHDSSPLQAGGWAAAKTRWYRPRRGRLRTEVHASFASEKVKKMPAVKNGFKIEIFNVPTSWSWRCSPITLLFSFLFGIAFQPSAWYNNGSITREAYR